MDDDFDNFLNDMPIIIPKRIVQKKDQNICCNEKMVLTNNKRICHICGYQVNDYTQNLTTQDFNYSHNSGNSTNIPAVTIVKSGNKKSIIVHAGQQQNDKSLKLKSEFYSLKDQCKFKDNIIDKAIYHYNELLVKNGILKKGIKKKGVQLVLIWLEYLNNGIPMTKDEICKLSNVHSNVFTKAYNLVYELNLTYKYELIQNNLNLLHDYITKYKPKFEEWDKKKTRTDYDKCLYKIDRFLLNMGNIVRDNHILNKNKHPHTLAQSILYYTCIVYEYPFSFNLKTSIVKNIKLHTKFLTDLRSDTTNIFYPYLKLIEDTFKLGEDIW